MATTTNVTERVVRALNNTASLIAAHLITLEASFN